MKSCQLVATLEAKVDREFGDLLYKSPNFNHMDRT